MKKVSLLLFVCLSSFSFLFAQDYSWTVTNDGIYRDGELFYLRGQSWAKQTPLTYDLGTSNETELKEKLSELSAIGVNTLRVYGSPDDSDWGGTSNFGNLIKWIEEWNVANPDGGDPNKAMYYLVQINPQDDESTISDLLPHNTSASFERAIHGESNPASVATLVSDVDDITGGSQYLLGYMIYHELNGSDKYVEWYDEVGASGIEDFMNEVADALHDTYAPGKLVTHTGDAKQPTEDIYEQIENLDNSDGNVLENFDIIGFNLYISTTQMLSEGTYYDRIPQRRGFSVNSNRGWYIGETGASSDVAASTGIPAVNYTQSQGLANLQIMWQKSDELDDLIGFMLFTVQDNDLGATISDDMKQRGHFDVYGDKKFLYYAYNDVIEEISTNDRYHYTDEHAVGVTIVESSSNYTITFEFENKTSSSKEFFWSIYGDDASTNQRFNVLEGEDYVTVSANSSTTIVKTVSIPSSNDLFAVEALVIEDLSPSNSYSYGRDHLLADAIGTVAGLNLNTNNLPDRPTDAENLSVSTSSVSFGSTGSSENVTISSNVDWTVSESLSWLTVSSTSGSDDGTISLSATENTSTSSRSGSVTISGGSLSETISISQSGISSGGSWSVIISDDFESGFGNWIDGGADCKLYTSGSYASGGSNALDLEDNTSTSVATTNSLDLSGYTQVMVDFSYYPVSFDNTNEDFWLQISTDGGNTFTTKKAWVLGTDFENESFYSANVVIDDVTLTSTSQLRFRCDASGGADDVYIDDVVVSAYGDGASNPTVPSAPSSLAAAGTSTSQIDLSWSDNSSDEDNFVIEQSLNGVDTWSQIASLSANTTAYSVTNLTASKTYYFRAYATNSAGDSDYSSIASATTKTETATEVTLTLNPTDDAYVRGGAYEDDNFGSDSELIVKQGSKSDYFRKSYLQFDIAAEGIADVTSAVVRLYASTANSSTVTAYETTDSWDEGSVTWSSAPSEGSSIEDVVVSSTSQYYEWDVTSYVQDETAGDGIVSLVFYDASAGNLQTKFSSKEAGSNLPQLVVTGTSSLKAAPLSSSLNVNNKLELFPNPVKDVVNFKNLEEGYTQYSIYNVMGSLVQAGSLNSPEIRLNDINHGEMLILRISGDNKQVITKRIVTQ